MELLRRDHAVDQPVVDGLGWIHEAVALHVGVQAFGRLAGVPRVGLLGSPAQAVAEHLAALGEAGLVSSARSGREVRYRLTPAPLSDAMAWMATVGGEWNERLEALARQLGPPPEG